MRSEARDFNQHRSQKNKTGGIIKSRVESIMKYVIDCYLSMLDDDPKISIAKINITSTFKVEDYLSNEFLDNYLQKRKISHFSQSKLNQIVFTKQSAEKYTDANDQKVKPDLIDIYVTNIRLEKVLSSSPQPYFAIECKRIWRKRSFEEYITDIKKFTDREYSQTRLPYEGQIAFIENPDYSHSIVAEEINKKLRMNNSISTIEALENISIREAFKGSYHSKHLKNFTNKNAFLIYHLMFDYTNILIN